MKRTDNFVSIISVNSIRVRTQKAKISRVVIPSRRFRLPTYVDWRKTVDLIGGLT